MTEPAARATRPAARVADPRSNALLAALPPADLARWLPDLESVTMQVGQVLSLPGTVPSHAWFPSTALVALLYVMEDGATSEMAVVGKEGLIGISTFLGGHSTPSRAVVQIAGEGFRLEAGRLKDAFRDAPAVAQLLLQYTQALIAQMAQTAACNRHHRLDQQLCRWLLLSLDRLPGQDIAITQELISQMLGVRREGVTEAAKKLQTLGLIQYARGHIQVLDRAGLERRSCECYGVVKREYDRLLPTRLAG